MNVVTPVDVLPERPYPGLRAFRQEEWPIFFGREEHIDEVIVRLARRGLVLVHGASGCGKSSLVRAGVLPALEASHGAAGRTWRTATMRPSEGLLSRLAEVLDEMLPPPAGGDEGADGPKAGPSTWAEFVIKGGGLVDHVEQAVRADGGGSFCLLIDQFEEIFHWARNRSEAQARLFIEFLKRVGGNGEETGFYVILTMRSDYLGQCGGYDGFAEYLDPRQCLLPRMNELGLLRAIYKPAELYGGAVDPAVAAMLLPVVADHIDGLPVLQHALMRALYHAQARARESADPGAPWRVTAEDLAKAGGAERALAQHADEVLARAVGDDEELLKAAEWIFRALTDLDGEGRAIRRPAPLGELIEASGVDRARTLAILKAFRAPDCSFICPYEPHPIDDEDELDISHEALIRQWPRLCDMEIDPKKGSPNGWVYREFHDGLIWRSLVVQAADYKKDRKNLLSVATTEQRLPWFRDIEARPRWPERQALSERRGGAVSGKKQLDDVKAMMKASERNLVREKGLIGRLRRVLGLLLFLLVASFGLAYWRLEVERQELEQQRDALTHQIDETGQANARLRTFALEMFCGEGAENSERRRNCIAEVEPVFAEKAQLSPTGASGDSAPHRSPAVPPPESEPAGGSAPAAGEGQQ